MDQQVELVEDSHFQKFYFGSSSFTNFSSSDWSKEDDDLFFPKSFTSTTVAVGKCVGTIHACPDRLLQWMWEAHSSKNESEKFPSRTIAAINFHHEITYSCEKLPPPLAPREWLVRGCFKKIDENKFVLLYMSVNDDDSLVPPNFTRSTLDKVIRGQKITLFTFERLPFDQTKLTMVAKLDLKGTLPASLAKRTLSSALNAVRQTYNVFQRDEEIDELQRVKFVDSMKSAAKIMSVEEEHLIHTSLVLGEQAYFGGNFVEAGIDKNKRASNWTRLRDGDLRVKKFKQLKQGDPAVWGKAEALIHAPASKILAYLWQYCSIRRMKEHQRKEGNLIRTILQPKKNASKSKQKNTQFVITHKSMPPPFLTREVNLKMVWGELSEMLVMAFEPAEPAVSGKRVEKKPPPFSKVSNLTKIKPAANNNNNEENDGDNKSVVQVKATGVWVIKPRAENICLLTFVTSLVDTGMIPGLFNQQKFAQCTSFLTQYVPHPPIHNTVSVINANIGRALRVVNFVQAFFSRTGLVADQELRDIFVLNVPRTVTTDEQKSFVQQIMDSIDYKDNNGWEKLDKDSSVFVKLSKKHNEGELNSWGKVSERSERASWKTRIRARERSEQQAKRASHN